MNDTPTPRRISAWWAVAAVVLAAAIWATVAMASGGSTASGSGGSTGTTPVASTVDPQGLFVADDGSTTGDDCPGHDGGSGGDGGSTTPSAPSTPTTPSTPSAQDGSSNPGL